MISDYADGNGIKLYHEIYGQGEPLVLIHGGLTTIGEMQGWGQRMRRFAPKWDSCCGQENSPLVRDVPPAVMNCS